MWWESWRIAEVESWHHVIETPYATGLDITTGLRWDHGDQGADLITEESAVHWEINSAPDVLAGSLDCPHITTSTAHPYLFIRRAERPGNTKSGRQHFPVAVETQELAGLIFIIQKQDSQQHRSTDGTY